MDALQLFRAGKLQEAIDALSAGLRDNPSDTKNRTFLFELLCFAGDYTGRRSTWSFCRNKVARRRWALCCTAERSTPNVRVPICLSKRLSRSSSEAGSQEALQGTLNGKPFHSLTDADPRIGARLEAFGAGDYFWIPLQDVAVLELDPPKRLRDLLWAPVRLRTGPNFKNKDLGEVLMPVIAPLSWQHADDEVKLGRVSEWCADEAGEEAPFGQKMLLVDGEEFPILEIRKLEILAPAAEG